MSTTIKIHSHVAIESTSFYGALRTRVGPEPTPDLGAQIARRS